MIILNPSVFMIVLLKWRQKHQGQKTDVTTETEVGVMCFEDERRNHEPRNAGGP